MRLVRDERGITLVELLVSMTLGLVVLGGVLGVFEGFIRQNRTTELRADAQDRARVAVDDIARNLRNQVGQASGTVTQFDRTLPNDLAFRTFDRAPAAANTSGLFRVRYCLDATTPTNARLIRQTQTFPTTTALAIPSGAECPATGWTTTTTLVSGLTNTRDGLNRPLWTYGTATDGAVTTTTSITTSLWNRVDPRIATSEVALATTIALRNANRAPVAAATLTRQAGTVILNAAPSLDPEGEPLRYTWTLNGSTIGTAQRIEWPLSSGSNAITLTIRDSGDLSSTWSQTVVR